MSPRKLADRLKLIREQGKKKNDAVSHHRFSPVAGLHTVLDGFSPVAEGVYRRVKTEDIPRPDEFDLGFSFVTMRQFSRKGFRGREAFSFPVRAEDLLFFDLETTGLSGGAGTVAFLFCSGRFVDEGFETTQVFLDDFPHEVEFIDTVLGTFVRDPILVSYNGRSFDVPLLRSRCVMTGNRFPDLRHADLVHSARRMFRHRLSGCSLGTIEREVLGNGRVADIPSSEIPDEYFSYLRTGLPGRMNEIAAHNALDITSLARLLVFLDAGFGRPGPEGGDSFLMARTLFSMGRSLESEEMLERLAEAGHGRARYTLDRCLGKRDRPHAPESPP